MLSCRSETCSVHECSCAWFVWFHFIISCILWLLHGFTSFTLACVMLMSCEPSVYSTPFKTLTNLICSFICTHLINACSIHSLSCVYMPDWVFRHALSYCYLMLTFPSLSQDPKHSVYTSPNFFSSKTHRDTAHRIRPGLNERKLSLHRPLHNTPLLYRQTY